MPTYEISCRCFDCKREHPIHMRIHLDNGPDRKMSVTEFFCGSAMPPQVATLRHHNVFCLKTGSKFKLEHYNQILLLPSAVLQDMK